MDCGRKIVFDNIDLYVQPHEVNEEKQNQDLHWVTAIATENRVAGNDLSSRKKPDIAILELENAVCLPDKTDHQRQRMNYAVLVSRIITTNLKCLEFLQGVKENHIAHQY